jgi:DNA-binding transcriptional MerR regulator
MFTIGDIATFTHTTVRALRLWGDRGLLVPDHVDPVTGYRYYRAAQVARVQQIVALQQLGLTLREIGGLLDDEPGAAEAQLAQLLVRRRDEVRSELQVTQQRLRAIEARLRFLEGSTSMSSTYEITRRTTEPVHLAAIGRTIDANDDAPELLFAVFGELFAQLGAALAGAGIEAVGPAWSLYDRADEHGITVHAALPVPPSVDLPSGLERLHRPSLEVATTVHVGDVVRLGEAYAAVAAWIESHGLQAAGGAAEVSLVWDPEHPEHNVTELQLAVLAPEVAPST